eukprot:Clim_evm7s239 gene=Clim_evmTU7s239
MKASVIQAVRNYISTMVSRQEGMKVILLDRWTTPIVSLAYSQSEILQKSVYLVDLIENDSREKIGALRAFVFIRPVESSIRALRAELKNPRYERYYIFFSNTVKDSVLGQLADADESEVVSEVEEFYADFLAVNPSLFHLDTPHSFGSDRQSWEAGAFERSMQGVCASLLALRKRPVIRYTSGSGPAHSLARAVRETMDREDQLFSFRTPDVPPVLLILDRRDDPVTPLLNQWTYQAMIHELLGIKNNRVDLSGLPGVKPEMKEVVLSTEQDEFYARNWHGNYGEVASAIKDLVDEFQKLTKSHQNINSIQDMKSFIENYPQFKSKSGTVSKHVTIMTELARLVDRYDLMELSEVEQSLACQNDRSAAIANVRNMLKREKLSAKDRMRLIFLYALRFETDRQQIQQFIDQLPSAQEAELCSNILRQLLTFAGQNQRQSDLFMDRSFLAMTRKTLKNLKGVENIYTQHEPYFIELLKQLARGKLPEKNYPFEGNSLRDRPNNIIVFIAGGATYAEAMHVHKLNDGGLPGVNIILGGTTLHSTDTFIQEMAQTQYLNRGPPAGDTRRAGNVFGRK